MNRKNRMRFSSQLVFAAVYAIGACGAHASNLVAVPALPALPAVSIDRLSSPVPGYASSGA
ncbi:MAG TPA: hypothetical protein VEN30_02650, partial [Paraburkholderia sp.]|nr:hypothetical protein [Paraburkholderia sp.]